MLEVLFADAIRRRDRVVGAMSAERRMRRAELAAALAGLQGLVDSLQAENRRLRAELNLALAALPGPIAPDLKDATLDLSFQIRDLCELFAVKMREHPVCSDSWGHLQSEGLAAYERLLDAVIESSAISVRRDGPATQVPDA